MKGTAGFLAIAAFAASCSAAGSGLDWPMFGRDASRNAASPEKNPPTDWSVARMTWVDGRAWPHDGEDRNVLWRAKVGEDESIRRQALAGTLLPPGRRPNVTK